MPSILTPEEIFRKLLDRSYSGVFEDNNVTSLGNYKFINLKHMTGIKLSALAGSSNTSTFQACSLLRYCVLPSLGKIGPSSFKTDPSLREADLGLNCNNIDVYGFQDDIRFDTLILRRTASIATLYGQGLTNTAFDNGHEGGTIYIPKALHDHLGDGTASDYLSNTNWSTLNGYGTVTWKKIEGSAYEYFYTDGTPISDVTVSQISATYTAPLYDFYAGQDTDYLRDCLTVTATINGNTYTLGRYMYEIVGEIPNGTSSVTIRFHNKTATVSVTGLPNPNLPEGYTQLRSVTKFTASAAQFTTNINENVANRFRAEYVIQPTSNGSSDNRVFATNTMNEIYPRVMYVNGSPYLVALCGRTETSAPFSDYTLGAIYKITADYYDTGAVAVNGVTQFTAAKGSTYTTLTRPFYIFYPDNNNSFLGRIYSLKLYQGNSLMHNFIPCIDRDGNVGMYDSIAQVVYYNGSSGTFYPD